MQSSKPESEKFSVLKTQLAAAVENEMQVTTKANPAPASTNRDVAVKLNAGAIMREERHFRKQMEEEADRLKAVEAGAFDINAFLGWEEQQRGLDEQQQMEDIEMNHLQGG